MLQVSEKRDAVRQLKDRQASLPAILEEEPEEEYEDESEDESEDDNEDEDYGNDHNDDEDSGEVEGSGGATGPELLGPYAKSLLLEREERLVADSCWL
jgi:hypothetical protein